MNHREAVTKCKIQRGHRMYKDERYSEHMQLLVSFIFTLQAHRVNHPNLTQRANLEMAKIPTSNGARTAHSCPISHHRPSFTSVVMDFPSFIEDGN